jgi:hypothetical protein
VWRGLCYGRRQDGDFGVAEPVAAAFEGDDVGAVDNAGEQPLAPHSGELFSEPARGVGGRSARCLRHAGHGVAC